ncbi:hypothetical protein DL96DRAFT_1584068 [Flagelloscypha sp. PMI_526]|nr:hypothetical protein DL96DRAFT_1584068 [Flagelloscypha sp. PMI_526]
MNGENGLVRDLNFYSDTRFLVFQVEQTLFRVKAKHLSEASPVFADMLSLPQPDTSPAEGETDQHPIKLEGERADTFRSALLWLKADRKLHVHSIFFSYEIWRELYEFSKKWQMDALRIHALRNLQLTNSLPIEKIKFALSEDLGLIWAIGAFRVLCNATQPTLAMARTMSPELFVVIMNLKEKIKNRPNPIDAELLKWVEEALAGGNAKMLVLEPQWSNI